MFTLQKQRKWTAFWLMAVVACLVLAGCKEEYQINPDFSVNLFQPGPKWPKIKNLSALEKEVYERYGKPDHFRIWWDKTGKPKQRLELEKQFGKKAPKQLPPHSWIYLERGKEILFRGNNYQEIPLSDQARTLVEYGDPEDVKQQDYGITQWMFYGAGKLYKFSPDGRIVEQKDIPAMGKFLKY